MDSSKLSITHTAAKTLNENYDKFGDKLRRLDNDVSLLDKEGKILLHSSSSASGSATPPLSLQDAEYLQAPDDTKPEAAIPSPPNHHEPPTTSTAKDQSGNDRAAPRSIQFLVCPHPDESSRPKPPIVSLPKRNAGSAASTPKKRLGNSLTTSIHASSPPAASGYPHTPDTKPPDQKTPADGKAGQKHERGSRGGSQTPEVQVLPARQVYIRRRL